MTSRSALPAALALMLAACATPAPVGGRPPIPPGVDPSHLHFSDAVVAAGDMAPDFTLPLADSFDDVTLSAWRGRPVVLVFASHT
jgi:hypothetical protein